MKCALIGNYKLQGKYTIVSTSIVKVKAKTSCFIVIYCCFKCSPAACFEIIQQLWILAVYFFCGSHILDNIIYNITSNYIDYYVCNSKIFF